MAGVGKAAFETRISWAVKQTSIARWNLSTSKRPEASWNLSRFRERRLQAVSSRNTNSEQGLVALMRPDSGTQFQSWMVVSNWSPGSPQVQADSTIARQRSRAG